MMFEKQKSGFDMLKSSSSTTENTSAQSTGKTQNSPPKSELGVSQVDRQETKNDSKNAIKVSEEAPRTLGEKQKAPETNIFVALEASTDGGGLMPNPQSVQKLMNRAIHLPNHRGRT